MSKQKTIFPNLSWPSTFFVLCVIVLLGIVLRCYGLNFGLPEFYDYDEPFMVDAAMNIAAGDLNPHYFNYPASTLIYPLAGLYRSYYQIEKTTDNTLSFSLFAKQQEIDPSLLYLTGRSLSLLYSLGSILLLFLLGKLVFSKRVGLLSSFFLAICPLAVERSKVIRVDSALLFFLLLLLYLSFRYYQTGKATYAYLSGAALGLSIASKYTGIVGVVVLVAALFLRWREKNPNKILHHFLRVREFFFALLSAVGLFLISSPFVIIDHGKAFADFFYEARWHQLGHDSLPGVWNYLWYLSVALPQAMGGFITVFGMLGVVFVLSQYRTKTMAIVLLLFGIFYWLFVGTLRLQWVHWILPVVPVLCLFAAYSTSMFIDWLENKLGWITIPIPFAVGLSANVHSSNSASLMLITKTSGKQAISDTFDQLEEKRFFTRNILLTSFFILLISLNPVYSSLVDGFSKSTTTTRELAANWIVNTVPVGSKIGREMFSPMPSSNLYSVYSPNFLAFHPMKFYQENNFDYLISTSYLYEQFVKENALYPTYVAFYDELFSSAKLSAEFASNPLPDTVWKFLLKKPSLKKVVYGYDIKIYRLKDRSLSSPPL
ncbi:MAG: glycosyltransferase family 39 protein [bacterium]